MDVMEVKEVKKVQCLRCTMVVTDPHMHDAIPCYMLQSLQMTKGFEGWHVRYRVMGRTVC